MAQRSSTSSVPAAEAGLIGLVGFEGIGRRVDPQSVVGYGQRHATGSTLSLDHLRRATALGTARLGTASVDR